MRLAVLAAVLLASAAPAGAQVDPAVLSQLGGKGGGLGGLLSGAGGAGLGGAGIGRAGLGNVAGLLGYCLKNQLLGSAGAGAAAGAGGAGGLLGKLTGKPGVTGSQGFLAGQEGVLSTGGANLPIGSLGDTVKQQLCRTVLSRARGLAGR